jgi:hypothetical protein
MKTEPMLQELEAVKERLAREANGDTRLFFEQLDAWLEKHPHAGPGLNSPAELQARLRTREATEPPPPPARPYRVHDPIIAEVHRVRNRLQRGRETEALILKDEPPRRKQ